MKPGNRQTEGTKNVGRRDFLRQVAALGAGLAAARLGGKILAGSTSLASKRPSEKTETRNARPDIVYRQLGRTRFMVSVLTFGGIALTMDNLRAMDMAIESGVNLVHTNIDYTGGASIRAIGEWLKKPGNRNRIFLALKAGPHNIDQELRLLNTEYVDLLMVPIHDPEPVLHEQWPRAFENLRKSGKARFMGLTFHSNLPAVFQNGLRANGFDVFLPTYNPSSRPALKPLLAEAKKQQIGLMTMKSTQGIGGGQDPVALWQTFLDDGIDTILRTMTSEEEVRQYIRLAKKGEKTSARPLPINPSGQCALCGACRDCPQGIAIQNTLRTYQYYARQLGWMEEARTQYAEIPPGSRAPACADCGRCEAVCPRNLAVRDLLREAHAVLA